LPEDWRAYGAEVLEQIAGCSGVFAVPRHIGVAVLEGLEQAERGEAMIDEQVVTLWKKCGL
jgi:hypothetical protein